MNGVRPLNQGQYSPVNANVQRLGLKGAGQEVLQKYEKRQNIFSPKAASPEYISENITKRIG